ncbi:MAG: ATP-binding protein [Bdellovibrionales bacterium]|jgi:PAS domain S-box-containing protein|nr:ATP-binding protein [Bdellovibrionales bacterium]
MMDISAPLRVFFASSLDLYCELDRDMRFLYTNDAWARTLGYTPSELIGTQFHSLVHHRDLKRSLHHFDHKTPQSNQTLRLRCRHKAGHFLTLQWSGTTDAHGQSIFAHGRDITEDVRRMHILTRVASIQDAYMRLGTKRSSLFNHVLHDFLAVTESTHGFIGEVIKQEDGSSILNPYAATHSEQELGLNADHRKALDNIASCLENGIPLIYNKIKGIPLLQNFLAIPLYYLGEHIGMVGVGNRPGAYSEDFVEKLKPIIEASATIMGLFHSAKRENALRERFMIVADNSPLMLTEFGESGHITWANRFFRERFDCTEESLLKENILPRIFPNPKAQKQALGFMLSANDDWMNFPLRDKDGHFFESRWINVPLKGGRAIGIGLDISELRAAEAKLLQSSKMASLGEMSAGVSHEINNPLAIIQGGAFRALQNLNSKPPRLEDVEADLNRIIQNCDRIARIVRGLRAFSRNVEHEPFMSVPFAEIIQDVLDLANEKFKIHMIDVQVVADQDITLDCRPVQLAQVIMNLLNNAFDAVLEKANADDESEASIRIHSKLEGERLVLHVEDSGAGIPPELRTRILDPFFTTKDVGKGTGLGLSISKGIIESHGGRLWLDTTAPFTRFVIELPIHQPIT